MILTNNSAVTCAAAQGSQGKNESVASLDELTVTLASAAGPLAAGTYTISATRRATGAARSAA